jgi:Fe-S oxidoreductase
VNGTAAAAGHARGIAGTGDDAGRSLAAPGATPDTTVAVFVGDAGTHLSPKTLDAAITLLRAAGLKPVPVGAGRSTGLLASSLGFPETATALARAVIAEVEAAGCRRLLTVSPGDRFAFERLYRERLDLTWPASIVVEDAAVVLAAALQWGALTLRRRANVPAYAYHDPCHAPRIDRDSAAPRALLAAALGDEPARRMFWREGRAHPCGATGGLEFTQPAIAASLADARLEDAVAAGATWLITDDPGCLYHLQSRSAHLASRGAATPGPTDPGSATPDSVTASSAAPGAADATGIEVRGLYELLVEQLQG